MVKYPQMKIALTTIVLPFAAVAARVALPPAPAAEYADTEAATNAALPTLSALDREFRLSLELDASATNALEVAFGLDADENGDLALSETDLSIGWSCGGWFIEDAVSGVSDFAARGDGRRTLSLYIATDAEHRARSISATDGDGCVFATATAHCEPSFFNPSWNLVRVTARGAIPTDASGWVKFSLHGMKVRLR